MQASVTGLLMHDSNVTQAGYVEYSKSNSDESSDEYCMRCDIESRRENSNSIVSSV